MNNNNKQNAPNGRHARAVGPEDLDAAELFPVLQVADPAHGLICPMMTGADPVPCSIPQRFISRKHGLLRFVLHVRARRRRLVAAT